MEDKTFLDHVGMPLSERAVMLHRRFPEVKITAATLGKYFRQLGVKKKQVVLKKRVKWGKRMEV